MTEEIINALSKINGLKVTARTSSFVFKNKKEDVRIIGNKLGVSTVLEGSIRKSGERVRISAQLIRTDNGFHIWSENFDRRLEDIFALQDDISLLIADRIRENFGHIEMNEHLVQQPTQNIEAYQLYLKGRYYQLKWNLPDIAKGIDYYKAAIAEDSQYNQPYFGAALCYSLLGSWGYMNQKEAFTKAQEYLTLGDPYANGSFIEYFAKATHLFWSYWNHQGAYQLLHRGLKSNGQDHECHDFLAEIHTALGNWTDALYHVSAGLKVNPLHPNAYYTKANIYYLKGDFDNALEVINDGLRLDPDFALLLELGLACLIHLRLEDELKQFVQDHQKSLAIPQLYQLLFRFIHNKNLNSIDQNELAIICEELKANEKSMLMAWDLYLLIYTGRQQEAIDLLEVKISAKVGQIVNFKNDPFLRPLQESSVFSAMSAEYFSTDVNVEMDTTDSTVGKSVMESDEVNHFSSRLIATMENDRLYLRAELTLKGLAASIDLHPNKLSWLLNEKIGKNFNDFINSYRLSAFQQKAINPEYKHLTLLGMAYESGFTSKSVFNDFFKKSSGMTPKAWVKKHAKN